MTLLPANIDQFCKFIVDERTGDYERYHWYCYYTSGTQVETFHRTWKITGTELALATDPDGLKRQRRERNLNEFRRQIEKELEHQQMRLIVDGDVLRLAPIE